MPKFTEVQEIHIDPYEYILACNSSEIKDLVEQLDSDGHIEKEIEYVSNGQDTDYTIDDESIDFTFKRNLLSLFHKWNYISPEDEEIINKIAEKY